jgi:hypothetical protein
MSKTDFKSVLLHKDTHQLLKEVAARQGRSLAGTIRQMLYNEQEAYEYAMEEQKMRMAMRAMDIQKEMDDARETD